MQFARYLVVVALLSGCITTLPQDGGTPLDSQIRSLECAIAIEAILQMRSNNRLADPSMVLGCPRATKRMEIDISARDTYPSLNPSLENRLLNEFQTRRMPLDLAKQIISSEAFEELMRLHIKRESIVP